MFDFSFDWCGVPTAMRVIVLFVLTAYFLFGFLIGFIIGDCVK